MPNFGDQLNVLLCQKLFNITPICSSPQECEAAFVGSLLDDFLYFKRSKLKLAYLKKYLSPKVKIWGSGFIAPENELIKRKNNLPETYFRRISVSAVRGKLSLERLKHLTRQNWNTVAIGDPGLLVNELINPANIKKKYKLGIIPHHIELSGIKRQQNTLNGLLPPDTPLECKAYTTILKDIKDTVLIDMESSPIECLKRIAECETIASSAMHGLIAADSFRIPNIRIITSDKLIGGDYKFNDYYSAYNLSEHNKIDLRNNPVPENFDKQIKSLYSITDEQIKRIKKDLLLSFPF